MRETLQRDRSVQSPYIRCYEINSPCRVPCWSVRDIARERVVATRGNIPRLRLAARYPPPRANPPRALNINRSAAERSAARGASRPSSHLSSQPTTDGESVWDFPRRRSQPRSDPSSAKGDSFLPHPQGVTLPDGASGWQRCRGSKLRLYV